MLDRIGAPIIVRLQPSKNCTQPLGGFSCCCGTTSLWPHTALYLRHVQVVDGRVYCLPDMYEVQDRSLADIQYVLNPTFTGGGDLQG